jgi:NodT family efflux transporter outer membrane factor (OMF) lipoprotein
VRRAVEAQEADTLASVEDRRGIAVASLAELAQNYLQLRGTQAVRALTERDLAVAEDDIRLVKSRIGNGYATVLDLAQAEGQRDTIASLLPPLKARQAQLINALGLLLAEPPRALEHELAPPAALPAVPPIVPVGLPGTLVRQRPDVQEAEAQLHAAVAETGVAVADFYPDITLTGDLNVQSFHTSNLFTLGSLGFGVGPSISIPIFEGGQLRGNLMLQESRQREAAISFQQTVLKAWQEVDDALTAYAEAQRQRMETARAVDQNQVALKAAQQRYAAGLVDMLNVDVSLSQLLRSETSLADNDVEIGTDLVNLYRALGGGWEIAEPVKSAGSVKTPDHRL